MEFTAPELWSQVLSSARTGIPEQSYRTWLAGSTAVGLSDHELIVEAPSAFHVEWVEDKYGSLLGEIVEKVLGRPLDLTFRCSAPSAAAQLPALEVAEPMPTTAPPFSGSGPRSQGATGFAAERVSDPKRAANLNDRYSFDRFVVGANNQLAAAACKAVGERPAKNYNPLFLYGGVGLGKTHLMHAIGHLVLERNPSAQVAYVTTERFMNELVNAIQQGTTPAFRRRFRMIDLLLVDDVHFLAQKESTQEEFFHTFNDLVDNNRQVVISADKSPSDLEGMEERLRSRLGWGLVADIHATSYELRLGIVESKAERIGVDIPGKVKEFLAHRITSNVRELEGALNRVVAHATLVGREISLETCHEVLHDILRANDRRVTIEEIQKKVAEHFNIRITDMHSARRARAIARPRQVAMYLAKQLTARSLPEIGRKFGGRDHTTVMHAVKKIEELRQSDVSFCEDVDLLRRMLEG